MINVARGEWGHMKLRGGCKRTKGKKETEILMKTAAMNFETTVKIEEIAIGKRFKYKSKAPVKRSRLIKIDNIDYL